MYPTWVMQLCGRYGGPGLPGIGRRACVPSVTAWREARQSLNGHFLSLSHWATDFVSITHQPDRLSVCQFESEPVWLVNSVCKYLLRLCKPHTAGAWSETALRRQSMTASLSHFWPISMSPSIWHSLHCPTVVITVHVLVFVSETQFFFICKYYLISGPMFLMFLSSLVCFPTFISLKCLNTDLFNKAGSL